MKLRNNKGYVMTDATIAILIALILVPTIMGIVYSIRTTKRASETKTGALNIATNALEIAKGIELEELDESEILSSLKSAIYKEKMTINENTRNHKDRYSKLPNFNKCCGF